MKVPSNGLFLAMLVVLMVICQKLKGQNLALNKPYTLSEKVEALQSKYLTDGIYSKKGSPFWTYKTTLQWKGQGVGINIDLEEVHSIGSVVFSTAWGVYDAFAPRNVDIFISEDGQNYKYVGDAMSSVDKNQGTYKVEKVSLNNINLRGRYVYLYAIPGGHRIYCDEIEVIKGPKNARRGSGLIPKDQLEKKVRLLKEIERRKAYLDNLSTFLSGKYPAVSKRSIDEVSSLASKKEATESDIRQARDVLGGEFGSILHDKYNADFIVEQCNPWSDIKEIYEPKTDSTFLNYHKSLIKDGTQYGAFVITNSSQSVKTFSFYINNLSPSVSDIRLFLARFIFARDDGEISLDPILPVDRSIEIEPGFSKIFLFDIKGLDRGTVHANILIKESKSQKQVSFSISSEIYDVSYLARRSSLNVNTFFDGSLLNSDHLMLESLKDMEDHHVNVVFIHNGSKISGPTLRNDYRNLLSYLGNFKRGDKILLTFSIQKYIKGKLLSNEWKSNFKEWYHSLVQVLNENGYDSEKLYLFPYDEVSKEKDIEDYKKILQWVRDDNLKVKFFATLNNKDAISQILPLIDIAQFSRNGPIPNKLPSNHAELWTYGNIAYAQSSSPYKDYRLKSWRAFYEDYTGIGFWKYATTTGDLNLIDDVSLNPRDFFVAVYNNVDGSFISTRRWEAFKLGIEDYYLLHLYEQKFGIEKAKYLAKTVLDHPDNYNLADTIREKILSE